MILLIPLFLLADTLGELPPPSTAACPSANVLERDHAAAAVRAELTPPQPSKVLVVSGVTLADDQRLVQALARAMPKKPPEACTSVLCALTGLLGSQEAAMHWMTIALHSGVEPLLDQPWPKDDLRAVAQAVLDLPPGLLHLAKVTSFRRIPDSDKPSNQPSVHAVNEAITFRDTAWKLPIRQLRELIAHELAHGLTFSLSSWANRSGSGDIIATSTTLANEEFANSVAAYRYTPRLLAAYAPAKFAYLRELLGERIVAQDEDIDRALAAIGGPLAQIMKCASTIQRASKPTGAPQAMLSVVTPLAGGGTLWVNLPRSLFLTRSSCVDEVLERMQSMKLECRHSREELYVKVADRLEVAWGAFAEAATNIASASPEKRRESCLKSGNISLQCFANTTTAEHEADRLITELGAVDKPTLARVLAAQSVVAPSDEAIAASQPWLGDPAALVGTCIGASREISTDVGQRNWHYLVAQPPKGEVLVYPDPVNNAGCKRAFFDAAKAHGLTVSLDDPLFDHLVFILRQRSAPALKLFHTQVLDQWDALRSACNIPAARNPSAPQLPCTSAWIKARSHGVFLEADAESLAKTVAPNIRGW